MNELCRPTAISIMYQNKTLTQLSFVQIQNVSASPLLCASLLGGEQFKSCRPRN